MKLALGTAQFGMRYGIANKYGKVSREEVSKIIELCRENQIKFIDTAADYGASEAILGEIGVEEFNVISKLPKLQVEKSLLKETIEKTVYESLARMKINNLYAILLRYSESLLLPDIVEELSQITKELMKNGAVNKLGVSVYSPKEALAIVEKYNDIGVIQSPFSILDRRILKNNFLGEIKKRNIEFHARSVFLQGLLLMNSNERPKKFDRWKSIWDRWDRFIEQNKLLRLRACVGYVKSKEQVDRIIIGVDSLKQLREIITAYREDYHYEAPDDLCSEDIDLIHPYNWENL
ncbi:MAG: aldo/keto reductase [Candidatus Bathyarchaeia archaeon]